MKKTACARCAPGIINHGTTTPNETHHTMITHTPFINTGIQSTTLRDLLARLLSLIPGLQEEDPRPDEGDVAVLFDDLAERHAEEMADALTRAGHRVKLAD